ncbi:hypothetical protein AC249_AIPGENE6000 [Exaiptasia diaphana]|nr:hypothetical protein AC249_AIPGENE6000 [Exaiptasia diaphana]
MAEDKPVHGPNAARGIGESSRLPFSNKDLLDQGWKVEGKAKGFKWTTESGKVLYSSKAVVEYLYEQGSDNDYRPTSATSESDSSPEKRVPIPYMAYRTGKRKKLNIPHGQPIQLPEKYHIAMTSQLWEFIEEINEKRSCSNVKGCEGKLIPVRLEDKGLGGAANVVFQCSGCSTVINYSSSQVARCSAKRNAVSLATALCFLIYGQGYPAYYKVLKMGMGIDVLAKKNFYNIIKIAHPHVKSVLDSMCESAKSNMQKRDPNELGSWQRAVTTSDGCWLIRGYHSQCSTFVIIDFLTGGILYYGHLCMRGSNNISDTELWQGTAKAAEGHMAHVLFNKAKEEGMSIALNWQDQDSSSGQSFRSVFPDGDLNRIMLCGGHVGRSHGNNIKEYKGKKVLDQGFIDKHKNENPDVLSVKCVCAGKKHSKNCGCINDNFILGAKRNHFSALKQSGNNPSEYSRRMKILGRYHCRDIHKWTNSNGETEECGFHPSLVCCCGNCGKKESHTTNNACSDNNIEGVSGCDDKDDADHSDGDEDGSEEEADSIEGDGDGSEGEADSIERDGDGSEGGGDSSDGGGDGSEGEADSTEEGGDSSEGGVDGSESDGDGSGGDGYDSEADESDDSDASDTEMDIKCDGKPYTTRCVLSCPLHALLYQIECERVAKKAADVVHTEMGRGHSNLPESKFNVLTRFRPKSVNLQQKHYEFITNIGLCQSNMTFMYNTAGKEYHWMRSVLSLMKLPVPDGIQDVWTGENTRRIKALEKQKTEKAKRARVMRKQSRLKESRERAKFVKRQKIVHSYGDIEEVEDIDEHSAVEEAKARLAKGGNTLNYEETAPPRGATVSVGGRKCKCGSSTHVRISHKSCKFYKSKAQ